MFLSGFDTIVLRKNLKSARNCHVTMLHPPKTVLRTDFCGAQGLTLQVEPVETPQRSASS
jgi:hypothetical protein